MGNDLTKETEINLVKVEEIIVKCEIGDMVKQFFKDSVIIWHDPNIENKPLVAQLEKFCQVKTFTQWDKASAEIKQSKATCHVITSEIHVKEICEVPNVHGVYILGKIQESLLEKKPKNLYLEGSLPNLLLKVERNLIKNYEEKASSQFAFAPIFNETDKKNLYITHMYLKVLPAFRDRNQAKKDFLTLCKVLYTDEQNFDFIINLTQNYSEQQTLSWFTQESLFSKVINKCLTISSSDSLQYYRLPIHDMQKAILEQYQRKSKHFSGLLYRAASLTEEEWTNVKANCNKEIEPLGFFSAYKDLPAALNLIQATEPHQKVIITILIPKGPNEEEYGFAEIETSPLNQVVFNTMSRFTILQANDKYSQDLPHRHLLLLYGAQGFRKYLTEKNPILKISIDNKGQILCDLCKTNKFFFKSLTNPQNHYCQECLHRLPPTNNTPFLCVPVSNNENKVAMLKGCVLTYPPDLKIPFLGNKCCQENATLYFKCTECHQWWCKHCIQNAENCINSGHAIILERSPFTFWQERMSGNELKELQVEKENMPKENDPDKQVDMFRQAHEDEKVLDYHLKLLEVFQKTKSRTSPELQTLYWNIAILYFKKKEYAKALQYDLELIKILQLIGYQNANIRIELVFNHIGRVYYLLREFSKAEEYGLKALEISILINGNNHPSQAQHYLDLAEVFRSQGKYQKAVEYGLKGLEFSKNDLSEFLFCLMLLGLSYYSLGDYKKAKEYCNRALDTIQSNLGTYINRDHLRRCYHLFRQIYEAQGDYKKALEYCLKALEASKDNDDEKSLSENYLGGIYQIQGEYEKALELHSKVLEKQRSVYGEDSLELLTTYYYLAQVYCYKGEYTTALEYCFKGIEIFKKEYKEISHWLAPDYIILGKIYEKKGEDNQALEYYLKAQELFVNFYGANHPDTGECYCDLGNVYNRLGEGEKAIEYQFRALQITEAAFGDNKNHPNLAYCYSGLGKVYFSKKDYKASMNYHLKALNIRKEVHGENHPDVADCYADIGDVYKGQGDHEKAREHYLKALEIRKLKLGDEHPETIAIQNLISEKNN